MMLADYLKFRKFWTKGCNWTAMLTKFPKGRGCKKFLIYAIVCEMTYARGFYGVRGLFVRVCAPNTFETETRHFGSNPPL